MKILAINCGSSSVKSAIVDAETGRRHTDIRIDGIAEREPVLRADGAVSGMPGCPDHDAALDRIMTELRPIAGDVGGVGHRVVHGGERFVQPTLIDDDVDAAIEALTPLAPLHNAACLAGIRSARRLLPGLPHVAVFDTAFHSTLPARARAYALPRKIAETLQIRRYGFHGISHEYAALCAARFLDLDLRELRIVTCHLGNGCSLAAVEYGRSIETSMGMTPLEGLVMGTRSGDIDPGVVVQVAREGNLSADDLDRLLNRESGLLGMTGTNDMHEIEERAARGDETSRLAIHVFTHRVRKYLGAYAAVMGGVDAIVFTGGIGENSALIRHRVAQRLDFLGARLDEDRNREIDSGKPVAEFSTPYSRTRLLVVATDEERLIAQRTAQVIRERHKLRPGRRVPIAVSARHVHLSPETIDTLFGAGHELNVDCELSQPGQYAAAETVTLVGPKRSIDGVRVIGPPRAYDQVEIARTDEFYLGLDAPVRASGDIENTPGITLAGPKGTVTLEKGVICAWRHIHMTPEDAGSWNVRDGDVVDVSIDGGHRDLHFSSVLIRVSPDYRLEMHVDTDEANAAELDTGDDGVLVNVGERAELATRKLSLT